MSKAVTEDKGPLNLFCCCCCLAAVFHMKLH